MSKLKAKLASGLSHFTFKRLAPGPFKTGFDSVNLRRHTMSNSTKRFTCDSWLASVV
jgi:hypothetical protein